VGTGEALLGPVSAGIGSEPAYNRRREVAGGREGVGGGRSSDDGRDNTTRLERRAPASPCTTEEGGTLMSAENTARSVRQAEGLDPFEPFNACSTAVPSRIPHVGSTPSTTSSPAAT
jgi:hypothetical protein